MLCILSLFYLLTLEKGSPKLTIIHCKFSDPVNVEFQTALLQFLREMSKEDVLKHFTKHYKSFRMKTNDKPEVCLLKCELLVQISTSEHGQAEIDQEIIKYLCHQLTQSQFNSDVKSGILKALFRLPKAEEILGSGKIKDIGFAKKSGLSTTFTKNIVKWIYSPLYFTKLWWNKGLNEFNEYFCLLFVNCAPLPNFEPPL